MRHLDLFSGIGGFALAARMVGGIETVGFCEIDPFCRAVLEKHWPGVRIHDDIKTLQPEEVPEADLWTAGFPCQDISTAGKGEGLHGSRSGLFFEIVRLLRGVRRRPAWVLLENVPALRTRGLDRVASEMEELGYAVGEVVVGAYIAGNPFVGERAWIVAAPSGTGLSAGREVSRSEKSLLSVPSGSGVYGRNVAGSKEHQYAWEKPRLVERPMGRTVDGIPARLVRLANRNALKAYGNSIVPQVAAEVMRAMIGSKEKTTKT